MFSLSPEALQQLQILEAALPAGLRASLKAIAGPPGDDATGAAGGTIRAFPEAPGQGLGDVPLMTKHDVAHADGSNALSTGSQSDSAAIVPAVPQPEIHDSSEVHALKKGGTLLEPSRDQPGAPRQPDAAACAEPRAPLPPQGAEPTQEPSEGLACSDGNAETKLGHATDPCDATPGFVRDQMASVGEGAQSEISVTQPSGPEFLGLSPAGPPAAGPRPLTETPILAGSPSLPGGPAACSGTVPAPGGLGTGTMAANNSIAGSPHGGTLGNGPSSLILPLQAGHPNGNPVSPCQLSEVSKDPGVPPQEGCAKVPNQETHTDAPAVAGDFCDEACFWPSEVATNESPETVWMRPQPPGPNVQPTQFYSNPIAGLGSAGHSADWGVEGGFASSRNSWRGPAQGWARGQGPAGIPMHFGTVGTLEQPEDPAGPWGFQARDLQGQYGSVLAGTQPWEVSLPRGTVYHNPHAMTSVPNPEEYGEQGSLWDTAFRPNDECGRSGNPFGEAQGRWGPGEGVGEAAQLPWTHVDPRGVQSRAWQTPSDMHGTGSISRRPSDNDVALVSQIHGILERVRTVRPPCPRLPHFKY